MAKWKKVVIVIGIILFALAGMVIGFNIVLLQTTGQRLEARLEQLRANGQAVFLADLKQSTIPPERNAVSFLRHAKPGIDAIVTMLQPIHERIDDDQGPLTEGDVRAIAAAFEAHPQVIPLLKRAAECADFNPERDYSIGLERIFDEHLTEVMGYRQMIMVLRDRATLHLADGKRTEALDDCLIALRLTRHLERGEPLLISYLVMLTCRIMSIEATNRVLRAGALPASVRENLETELALHNCVEAYRFAIRSERAWGVDAIAREYPRAWFFQRAAVQSGTCHYLDVIHLYDELAEQSYAEAVRAHSARFPQAPRFYPLGDMAREWLDKTRIAMEHDRARIRCLRTLNALHGYVEPTGKAEPKLEEVGLPAEVTTDPFNGLPLRLKKGSGDWIIYSVGINLRDDGGDFKDGTDVGLGPVK